MFSDDRFTCGKSEAKGAIAFEIPKIKAFLYNNTNYKLDQNLIQKSLKIWSGHLTFFEKTQYSNLVRGTKF